MTHDRIDLPYALNLLGILEPEIMALLEKKELSAVQINGVWQFELGALMDYKAKSMGVLLDQSDEWSRELRVKGLLAEKAVGISMDRQGLSIVRLGRQGGLVEMLSSERILFSGTDVLSRRKTLLKALSRLEPADALAIVPDTRAWLRFFDIEPMPREALDKVVEAEAGTLFPFPLSTAYWGYDPVMLGTKERIFVAAVETLDIAPLAAEMGVALMEKTGETVPRAFFLTDPFSALANFGHTLLGADPFRPFAILELERGRMICSDGCGLIGADLFGEENMVPALQKVFDAFMARFVAAAPSRLILLGGSVQARYDLAEATQQAFPWLDVFGGTRSLRSLEAPGSRLGCHDDALVFALGAATVGLGRGQYSIRLNPARAISEMHMDAGLDDSVEMILNNLYRSTLLHAKDGGEASEQYAQKLCSYPPEIYDNILDWFRRRFVSSRRRPLGIHESVQILCDCLAHVFTNVPEDLSGRLQKLVQEDKGCVSMLLFGVYLMKTGREKRLLEFLKRPENQSRREEFLAAIPPNRAASIQVGLETV